ncbi:hypothetical protein FH972_022686 [Carpinus fangiana]|uniref:DUF4110 domain-containing protein n=1 Tax=Carpinus fangiana TaxID=176857 RepID=A0A5N6KTA1_9ROSI|nr:hypothetical protein FH972_022686 [Carpinus fangiana]
MAKKDKKTKDAEKKARVAQKTAKKSAKSEKKAKGKKNDDDSDAEGDVDLDAVLAEYARAQEQFLKVTETVSPDPPSARSSATFAASPSNLNELFLFGGEHYNGALARFYNDLFVYNINRDEWRIVQSPNSPLPRSGHAWTRGGNTGGIYLFGGEFSSPKQGTFYHYNDFWRLEPSTREWTKVESPKGKGPPARSGHRMTYWKQYIILFGGFQDTSSTTKYLSDLFIYDTVNYVWHTPTLPPASQKPDPRSSFTLLPHEQGAVMYGGYSRVKVTAGKAGNTRQQQKNAGPQRDVLKPLVHTDAWYLRMTQPPEGNPSAAPSVRWERRKKPANVPQPPRAGATMAHHKGRGIQFGGVHDVEESEEGIESEFFNGLGVWNIERNRYFPLSLRKARQAKKTANPADDRRGGGGARGGRGKKDEEDLLANLRALELKAGGGSLDDTTELDTKLNQEDEDEDKKVEKPVLWEMPHPRFNAQLAVQDDVLYVFGGTFEKADREFTFSDLYAVDLGKLDGVKELFRREVDDWIGEESSSEDDDEDEDDDEGSDEEEQSEEDNDGHSKKRAQRVANLQSERPSSPASTAFTEEDSVADTEITEPDKEDNTPHPRPFESLRDFFQRTGNAWQEIVIEEVSRKPKSQFGEERQSIKDLRKTAFEKADEKWWDCREEIQALEDEQEEAGIGEVVSLADKGPGGTTGGVGRRR